MRSSYKTRNVADAPAKAERANATRAEQWVLTRRNDGLESMQEREEQRRWEGYTG